MTATDGTKVGWYDLLTDEPHPETAVRATEPAAAVRSWQASNANGAVASDVPVRREGTAVSAPAVPGRPLSVQPTAPVAVRAAATTALAAETADWDDLADRRAGALAREQAVAGKQAAPVKTLLARALGLHTDERAWRIGADGEEKVAAQLAKLQSKDPRWHLLHAIPVGENGSDIDHVVIGPGGVFTLNAKHHPGANIWVAGNTFMVNGQQQPYLRNSAHEARRAGRLVTAACGFPVAAIGVIPVGAQDVVIKTAPETVHVVYRREVAQGAARAAQRPDRARHRSDLRSRPAVHNPGAGKDLGE